MKSSIASRSLKLLSLATQVGRKELAQNLKDQFTKGIDEMASGRLKTRLEQARLIAEHLSQLKGAAMKAGQLLSLDAADYFPPEAIELLSKLQGQADPVEWSLLREVLVAEFGEEKINTNFVSISETASASASIGQVHRGKIRLNDGSVRDVAIKIQYPGIADSIDSDLAILRTLAQSMLSLTGRKIDLTEVFKELSVVLKQEADYVNEANNMAEFRSLASPHTDFVVPEPFFSHTSQRVLAMSWEQGLTINEWLKTSPSQSAREHIGRHALDLYCMEFFDWGFVQTDPNFANFMVQENPLRLVVLDFGAALRYTPEFRSEYVELLKALGSRDRTRIIRTSIANGLIEEREGEETLELFADLLLWSLEPFHPARQPFRFRDDEYARRSKEIGQRFTQSLKFSAPPKKILFLHRKLGGIFTLLKKLDVQLDLLPYWERMVGPVKP